MAEYQNVLDCSSPVGNSVSLKTAGKGECGMTCCNFLEPLVELEVSCPLFKKTKMKT